MLEKMQKEKRGKSEDDQPSEKPKAASDGKKSKQREKSSSKTPVKSKDPSHPNKVSSFLYFHGRVNGINILKLSLILSGTNSIFSCHRVETR